MELTAYEKGTLLLLALKLGCNKDSDAFTVFININEANVSIAKKHEMQNTQN